MYSGAKKQTTLLTKAIACLTGTLLLFDHTPLLAEYPLNFTANSGGGGGWGSSSTGCSGSGGGFGGGWGGSGGPSGCGGFFLQESVDRYTHVIIGNPETDDFALEWYIGSGDYAAGSASSPLSSDPRVSGVGSGNPTRIHMRLILQDDGYKQEYLKARDSKKPLITQSIVSGTMQSEFALDMTNSGYSDINIPGSMTNRITVEGLSEFDAATDLHKSTTFIGQFTYSSGQYRYKDGNFDLYDINWVGYCDPFQNTEHDCHIGGNSSWDGGGGWGW